MENENQEARIGQVGKLLAAMLKSPWIEVAMEAWKLARKVWRGWAEEGMYEVLDYEAVLELQDRQGEHALVRKRQKVRYLQNNIIAYQDQAWGDGEILLNYRCTPGEPVDRYRPDKKTYILISLREVKSRGDEDEFHIQWEFKHGFTRPTEVWSAEVSHRMRHLTIRVIFPAERRPFRTALVEGTTQKVTPLPPNSIQQLPDGRYEVTWETHKPRLYETYAIRWEW